MLEKLFTTLASTTDSVLAHIHGLLWIILVMWVVQVVNVMSSYRLNAFGVIPRTRQGLLGIICSPFLHGSWGHIFCNTTTFLVLGGLILVQGKVVLFQSLFLIYLGSGLFLWIFGRPARHVGASGVVLGCWGFLLLSAYYQQSFVTLILAIICIFYFGSLVLSFVPEEKVSWDGHLFGFFAGWGTSYLMAKNPPWLAVMTRYFEWALL